MSCNVEAGVHAGWKSSRALWAGMGSLGGGLEQVHGAQNDPGPWLAVAPCSERGECGAAFGHMNCLLVQIRVSCKD